MKQEEIKSPSNEEFREQQQKSNSQKLNIQSLKILQEEIKKGTNLQPINNGKLSRIHEESPNSSAEDICYSENEENYLQVDGDIQRDDKNNKKKQKEFQGSIVVLENYAVDNKNPFKDSTQMRLNQKRFPFQDENQSIQTASDKFFNDESSVYGSHASFNSSNKINIIQVKEFSCTDLLEKTGSNKFLINDQMSNGIISSTIDENDLIQIDTLREYYMENDDQLEQLRRQQTADFQFNNPNDEDKNNSIQNPYKDDKTLLAVEKIGTLSPSKIMDEIRQINLDLNLKNENLDEFYENDTKTQIYMIKLQMKARMEDGLIQQRLELKTILNQYLQFIDKLMKDKKNLSETLQFSQTENLQLRDQLHEVMSKYDDTENQIKQIFISHKQQSEQSKREVELKEKKISQITEQMVLQEQGVKNIKQKYEQEYKDLVQQNKEIMKQIMELNKENEFLKKENEQYQLKNIDMEQKKQILEDDLQQLRQNNQILAQKNTSFEENDKQNIKLIQSSYDVLTKIKQQLDKMTKDQELENKDQFILSDREKQKQNIIQLSNMCYVRIETIQQKMENMRLQNSSLQKINQEFGIKIKENETIFQQLVEQQNKQYQTLISNLKNDVSNNKQIISNLQQSFDLQTRQSNNTQSLNTQLQQEITFLKQQITELQSESQADNNKIQEKEQMIYQLENSVLKYKDQINKNLIMIDDIFNGFKQKETLYHQEINEQASDIKYLKEIISKYEQGVSKYYSQNEQIQLQQIDLLRSYLINHESVRSSKIFIDQQQLQQTEIQSKINLSVNDQTCQIKCQQTQMNDSAISQKDCKNITPTKTQNQLQTDSLRSTQIIESKDRFQNMASSQFLKKISQSTEDGQKSQDINRNIQIFDRSESPICVQYIESQRYTQNEQKNLVQSIDIDKSVNKSINDKDDSLNQLLKVMNNLKIIQEGEQ